MMLTMRDGDGDGDRGSESAGELITLVPRTAQPASASACAGERGDGSPSSSRRSVDEDLAAAQRTLLAWVRTAFSLGVFALVVSRLMTPDAFIFSAMLTALAWLYSALAVGQFAHQVQSLRTLGRARTASVPVFVASAATVATLVAIVGLMALHDYCNLPLGVP